MEDATIPVHQLTHRGSWRRTLYSMALYPSTDYDALLKHLEKVAEENLCLSTFSHHIAENPDRMSCSVAELERILKRAQELMPGTTEITKENAGELVSKAGVMVRAYAECGRKFTEMLMAESSGIQRDDIVERDRVMRKDGDDTPTPTPDPSGGGDDSGGGGGTDGGDET
jgi:hypothetical protein